MPTAKLISKKPVAGTPKPWSFPKYATVRLESGFRIVAAHVPGFPLGAALILLDAGASNDPERQGGVAAITGASLTEGTKNHKGIDFVKAVEALGAEIGSGANWDAMGVSLQSPIDRMEQALELAADCVRRPAMTDKDINRLRLGRMGGIQGEYAGSSTRGEIAFNRAIYTPSSPYSRSAGGTYTDVENLTKGKIRKFYKQFVTPGSAALCIAGDMEGFPIDKLAEKLFGDWKAKEPEHTTPRVEDAIRGTYVVLVNRPEAKQSQISIGHVGIPRSTPDYFPVQVMASALGGPFNSRLNMKLREEKGFTYGAGASFSYRRAAGPFRAGGEVETKDTVEAIVDTVNVIQEVHEGGIATKELEDAKSFISGVFPLNFETPSSVVNGLADLVVYDLPENYYETYVENVRAVTHDQANQAASDHLRPDKLAIVVVGNAEKVADSLRAEYGPVAVIEDPDPGEPLPE